MTATKVAVPAGDGDDMRDDNPPTDWDHFVAAEAALKSAAAQFVRAIESGDAAFFGEAAQLISGFDDGWNYAFTEIVRARPRINSAIRREFLNHWAWYGPHVRRSAYGDGLLADALRLILKYRGPPCRLYRVQAGNRSLKLQTR